MAIVVDGIRVNSNHHRKPASSGLSMIKRNKKKSRRKEKEYEITWEHLKLLRY